MISSETSLFLFVYEMKQTEMQKELYLNCEWTIAYTKGW